MTKNKRAKRDARERQQVTGERYTVARRSTVIPGVSAVEERRFEPDHCANCLEALPERIEALFCSELCSQTAETVRYWRRISCDARINDPEVKLALRTRIAHLLAGGYRRQARKMSDAVREQVWARDSGGCVQCGKPGAEIDHIRGDSSDPANLQLLCLDCHHRKTAEQMAPASDEQKTRIDQLFAERVMPELPSLLCDDEVHWAAGWRALTIERRVRLLDLLLDMGYDRTEFHGTSWADMWDEVFDAEADVDDDGGYTEDDDSGYGPHSYFAHAMAKDD
jgi:5-methylcytosine-specific restriction endonuclease McrA